MILTLPVVESSQKWHMTVANDEGKDAVDFGIRLFSESQYFALFSIYVTLVKVKVVQFWLV
jgi:hypothetical protein